MTLINGGVLALVERSDDLVGEAYKPGAQAEKADQQNQHRKIKKHLFPAEIEPACNEAAIDHALTHLNGASR